MNKKHQMLNLFLRKISVKITESNFTIFKINKVIFY